MIKSDIENSLGHSAISYLQTGMELFHNVRYTNYTHFQPALGNLCISIELMLKTLISKKCIHLLFTNLPLDLQMKLIDEKIAKVNPISKSEENKLRYFQFNSQELDKCISIFYTINPKEKPNFKPYLALFASLRNITVHGAIPKFQKYDLERIAYLALQLQRFFTEERLSYISWHKLTTQDTNFLASYDSERVERVKKAIEAAKTKSDKVDYWSSISLDDWDILTISCPICDCKGVLTGTTERILERAEHGDSEMDTLSFYADSFKCDECGLELLDIKEIELAGMDTTYDRDSDLDKWYRDQGE